MKLTERETDGVLFLASPQMDVPHGFSTRLGGVSAGVWASMNLGTTRGDAPDCVRENYRRFCRAIGAEYGRIVMANQVHSDIVRPVTAAEVKRDLYDPEGYTADGLTTDVPGLALVVFAADCIPILLYDPVRRAVGAVHAGWRGTAAGIAARAVEQMCRLYGSRPADIRAAIGPGIGPCCFETHGDVPAAMRAAFGSAADECITAADGEKFRVDLKRLNARCLTEAGVRHDCIDTGDACTACNPERYWSHRVHQGARGSQIGMIALDESGC